MEQHPPQEEPQAVHPNRPLAVNSLTRTCLLIFLVVWYAQYYTNGPLYQLLASTAPWTPSHSHSIFSARKGASIANPHTRSVTTVIGTATRTLAQHYVQATSSWTSTETHYSTALHAYGPGHTHTVEYRVSAVVVSTEVSEIAWTDVTPPHNRVGIEGGEGAVPPNTCRNVLPTISPPYEDLCLPP